MFSGSSRVVFRSGGRLGSFQVPEDFLQALRRRSETQRKSFKPILFMILGSCSALAMVSGIAYWGLSRIKKKQPSVVEQPGFSWKQAESSLVSLGSFVISLQFHLEKAPLQLAQVEIVLLCSDSETADYFREYTMPARNQIFRILHALSPDDFLSYEGKKRLREFLRHGLNAWLSQGYVRDVYFSKLVVNSS